MNQPAIDHPPIDSFTDKYWFLSNFSRSLVTLGRWRLADEHLVYPTLEHGFQAAKSLLIPVRCLICVQSTPGHAKRVGRSVSLRQDWEEIKEAVMLTLLREKFTDKVLRDKLAATFPAYLEEGNAWGDVLWGTVGGRGLNRLGIMLMQVRDEILHA